MNNQIIRLRRSQASAYLKEKFGISRTPGTLAKLAVIGGSPKFQMDGRIPLYPENELDAWALAKLSPLKSNTSGARANHAPALTKKKQLSPSTTTRGNE